MSLCVKEFPVELEYKKNKEITPDDIARLRAWIKTQPHLPEEHISDLDLILIYHSCNLSAEVSKQLVDTQYTLKTLFSTLFEDRKVDAKSERALNTTLCAPLPTRSKEGYACFYAHFIDKDPKNFVVPDIIRIILMVTELWQYEEGTWPGFMVIADLQGIGIGHLSRFEVQSVQQFFCFLQEALPLKLKALHFMNAPPFMDKIMMLMKPFMKKQVLDLIFFHATNSNSLFSHYPKEGLPKDAGGNYRAFEELKIEMIDKLKSNTEFFEKESKKRVTESLRPGKPKTITDFFGGVEGSFKKLQID